MEIRRVATQCPQTVVEFYLDMMAVCKTKYQRMRPQCMMDLLQELKTVGPDLVLWGMTAHESLALVTSDNTVPGDWVAHIYPTSAAGWEIVCPLPVDRQPWPNATVSGQTNDLAEAVRRVKLSCEWAGLL